MYSTLLLSKESHVQTEALNSPIHSQPDNLPIIVGLMNQGVSRVAENAFQPEGLWPDSTHIM